MRGMIKKRGTKWNVVLDEGRDENGRRQRRWYSGFRTKRDAQARLTELLGAIQTHTYTSPTKLTVATFLEQWLAARKAQVRASTWHGYRKNAHAYIVPALGSLALQSVTPQRINAFYAALLASGRRDGSALSARTVRGVHMLLRRALADAVRWRQLTINPADQADPPRAINVEMRTWTPGELREFLAYVRDDRLYALWMLAATTGLRRAEVLGLRWRDLALDAATLAVTQTLNDVGHKLIIGEPKTAAGKRVVALDQVTIAALREHRKRQLEERLAFGAGFNDGDLVFVREDGAPIHPAWLTRAFGQRVKAAGAPVIRLHDLRHTSASLALAAGIHPKVVSERLGHANVSITLNTYSHTVPAMQQDAAEKVAAIVFGR